MFLSERLIAEAINYSKAEEFVLKDKWRIIQHMFIQPFVEIKNAKMSKMHIL